MRIRIRKKKPVPLIEAAWARYKDQEWKKGLKQWAVGACAIWRETEDAKRRRIKRGLIIYIMGQCKPRSPTLEGYVAFQAHGQPVFCLKLSVRCLV